MRIASKYAGPTSAPLLAVSGVLLLATATPALSQSVSDEAAASQNGSETAIVDTVTVTGVRGRPRTVATSPAPIDVLPAEQLETVGRSGVQEALNALLPSYNLPAMSGAGTGGVIRAAGLRGLQADQVLVLVNGKRRHNSALLQSGSWSNSGSSPADLDMIPSGAIRHIEVLRDGASAQYGSDAISGVINIILNQSTSGGRMSAMLGQNYHGDGLTAQLNASRGFALPNDGYLFLAADYRNQADYTRATPVDRLEYNAAGQPVVVANEVVNFGYGAPKAEATTLSFNSGMTVGGIDFYAFGTAGYKEGWKHGNFRQATANGNIVEIYPEGSSARAGLRQKDYQLVMGGSGEIAGWSVDASTSIAHDQVAQLTRNNLNPTLGPSSPQKFYLGSQIFTQWTNNLDFTKGFDTGMAEPTQISAGLEHRYEQWKLTLGEPLSYADGGYVYPTGPYAGREPSRTTGVRGVSPQDAGKDDRNVVAAYVDVAIQPTKALYAALAVRHERYDDSAGDTTNYKLSTRYEFTPDFAIRATASTGFRAPSVAQSVYQQSSASSYQATTGGYTQYYYKVLAPGSQIAAELGGKPLVPETSVNYSVGLTWQPLSNATLTIDAYRIDIDDRIVMSSTLTGTAVVSILERYGLRGFNGAQFYNNAVDTRTDGVDVVGEYRADYGDLGRVRWSLGYNHNETEVRRIDPLLGANGQNYEVFGHSAQGYLEHGNPKDKVILGAAWDRGPWAANLRGSYYGSVIQPGTTAATDREFGGKWIVDLSVDYELQNGVTLSAGANNLFDTYPDDGGVVSSTGFGAYGYISPFGFGGGYYFARVSYKF